MVAVLQGTGRDGMKGKNYSRRINVRSRVSCLKGGWKHPFDPDLPEREEIEVEFPAKQNCSEEMRYEFWKRVLLDFKEALFLDSPEDQNLEIEKIAKDPDPIIALKNSGLGKAKTLDDQWMLELRDNIEAQFLKDESHRSIVNVSRLLEIQHSLRHLKIAIDTDYARPSDFWLERHLLLKDRNQYYFKASNTNPIRLRVCVVGGSIAGLIIGLSLMREGHEVWILERSKTRLQEYGIPVVLDPATIKFLRQIRAGVGEPLGIPVKDCVFARSLSNDEWIEHSGDNAIVTSWQILHNCLKRVVRSKNPDRYVHGAEVANISLTERNKISVELHKKNSSALFDIAILATGNHSGLHHYFEPKPIAETRYMKCLCFHGWVLERDAPDEVIELLTASEDVHKRGTHLFHWALDGSRTQFSMAFMPGPYSQMASPYRRLVWFWRRNETSNPDTLEFFRDRRGIRSRDGEISQGRMRTDMRKQLRTRAWGELPSYIAELIEKTDAPGVFRIESRIAHEAQYYDGRLLVVGDSFSKLPLDPFAGISHIVNAAEELVIALRSTSDRRLLGLNMRLWAIRVRNRIHQLQHLAELHLHRTLSQDSYEPNPGDIEEAKDLRLPKDVKFCNIPTRNLRSSIENWQRNRK